MVQDTLGEAAGPERKACDFDRRVAALYVRVAVLKRFTALRIRGAKVEDMFVE